MKANEMRLQILENAECHRGFGFVREIPAGRYVSAYQRLQYRHRSGQYPKR